MTAAVPLSVWRAFWDFLEEFGVLPILAAIAGFVLICYLVGLVLRLTPKETKDYWKQQKHPDTWR